MALAGLTERLAPRRPFSQPVPRRWLANSGLLFGGLLLVSILLPAGSAVAVAVASTRNGIGLLNNVPEPRWLGVAVAVVALDLCMWLQHWVQHRVGLLWRSHRVHHSDPDLDFTTALRFHPFESVFTALARMSFIVPLGLPLAGVVIYEVTAAIVSTCSHASLPIPERLDRALRAVIVTPDVHRVHHSLHPVEMQRNFGTVFTLWDRLFGTYRGQPEKGHQGMVLGLDGFEDPTRLDLFQLLAMPFRSRGAG